MSAKKAENEKNIDEDIQQCKEDILRSSDIIPPYSADRGKSERFEKKIINAIEAAEKVKKADVDKEKLTDKDVKSIPIETISAKRQAGASTENLKDKIQKAERQNAEIPQFDLAEQIMAKHRKVTAIKRKAPDKTPEIKSKERQVQASVFADEKPVSKVSDKERIIADIVARDIEKLRRGGRLGV